jgi:thiamine-monophosphate kinase
MRGEDELVEACLAGARAVGADTESLILGPGDDAAILRPPPGHDLAWTSDEQVEDVHFRRAWGEALGYAALGSKAAGASLSDLAAMGARPLGALFSLRLPPELLSHAEALGRGVGAQLAAVGCPLAGGNLARADRLGLTVDALGALPRGRALRRDAARAGDALYVSGPLGWAALGLRWLEARRDPGDPEATRAVEAICRPRPRIELGQRLLELPRVACLDLSDGLARDSRRLARASGVRLEIEGALIPGPAATLLPGLDVAELAWGGGEDYELLIAGPASDLEGVEGLIRIGAVTAGEGVFRDGQASTNDGHDHFPRNPR